MMYFEKIKRVLAVILVLTMVSMMLPINSVKASTYEKPMEKTVVTEDNLEITFKITSQWNMAFNADVTIQNNGDSDIDNWSIAFELPYEITNIWNGCVVSHENDSYIIKNVGSNQDIVAGGTISFGFSANCTSTVEFPEKYTLLTFQEDLQPEKTKITYNVTSDWNTGFNGKIDITNTSNEVIEDWLLQFDFDYNIDSLWTANIIEKKDNHYVIKNAGYNAVIQPGQTISLGFTGNSGDNSKAKKVPVNYTLTQITYIDHNIITIDETNLINKNGIYQLNDNFDNFYGTLKNADQIKDFRIEVYDKNSVLIHSGKIKVAENWNTEKLGLINGYNKVVFTAVDSSRDYVKTIEAEVNTSSFMRNLQIDLNDDDNDGLWNYFESYFGTDPKNPDTDGDGLSDFVEIYTFNYNPLEKDTDKNGISDHDEDCDGDGICNGKEIELGLNPFSKDSDKDGLEDAIELEFGTDPLKQDTDGDGISDYDEYMIGSDMLKANSPDEVFTKSFDCEQFDITKDQPVYPSIELSADARGISTFTMKEVETNPTINYSMAGYIGCAFDFTMEGQFKSASLTFTMNPDYIGTEQLESAEFEPTVYYYDEENQSIVEVENQTRNGNQVTAKLEHFSTYLLVNKADLQKLWNRTVKIPEGENTYIKNQIVFVLDSSGSMDWNDPNFIRTNLTKQFIEKLNPNDEIGIVGFETSITCYTSELTTDKATLYKAIKDFENYGNTGGTYLYKGLQKAQSYFKSTAESDNYQKCIFVLTDGIAHDTPTSSFLTGLKNRGIKVYTVGLGNVSESYLKNISDTTGGEYYYAKVDTQLKEVFLDFEDDISVADTNKDGISDVYTEMMCNGEITTITGTRVFNEGDYEEIQRSDDFDGDGLKNGEEVSIYFKNGKPYARISSSPMLYDTDFDGYSDYEEVRIFKSNPNIPTSIMYCADEREASSFDELQSYAAAMKYIEQSSAVNVLERFFDVLLCGGEISMEKVARKDLVNYMVDSANYSQNEYYVASYLDTVNNILRGANDILPFTKGTIVATRQTTILKEINEVSKQVQKCRRSFKYMSHHLTEFQNSFDKLTSLQKDLENVSDSVGNKINSVGNKVNCIGLAISFATCTLANFCDMINYFTNIEICKGYEDLVVSLWLSGDSYISDAAYTIYKDLEGVCGKWLTVLNDYKNDLLSTGAITAASILTAGLGPVGIVMDLAAIGGGIIFGDSLSTRLNNSMTVNIALEIQMIYYDQQFKIGITKDSQGNLIRVIEGQSMIDSMKRFFGYAVSSKIYSEKKYVEYLNSDSKFFDADAFLYKKDDSKEKAEANIQRLTDLIARY